MRAYELKEKFSDLTFWHGTSQDFDEFDLAKTGYIGFYFAKNKDDAMVHARYQASFHKTKPVIIAVSLDLKNPLYTSNNYDDKIFKDISNKASGGNPRKFIREELLKMGYDAVINPSEVWVFNTKDVRIIK